MLNERKKSLGRDKPQGFGSPQLGPVNQEAERIIRGMKNQNAHRFKRLYGKRDKEVMTLTANKLALKDQLKVMYYKDFIDLVEGNPTARMLSKSKKNVTGHISADRGDDEKKNRESRKGLEKDLKKKGIGYKKGVGEYKYSSGEGTGREVSYQTSKPDKMSKRRFGKVMRRLGRSMVKSLSLQKIKTNLQNSTQLKKEVKISPSLSVNLEQVHTLRVLAQLRVVKSEVASYQRRLQNHHTTITNGG